MSLSFGSAATLFATMLVLALVPSLSVFTVTSRAASHGFVHGAAAAAGIVMGDLIFIFVAVLGLAALAASVEGGLVVLKYAGGAYLIWLGVRLWRSRHMPATVGGVPQASLFSSFWAGLLLTLGDQKAILFYLVFFPAFVDLAALTTADIVAILVIATLSVGAGKLAYAFAAARAGTMMTGRAGAALNTVAACIMVAVGVFLIAKP